MLQQVSFVVESVNLQNQESAERERLSKACADDGILVK